MAFPLAASRSCWRWARRRATAHLAQQYLFGLAWGVAPALWFIALRGFMGAVNRPQPMLWITLAAIPANALLVYLLIYGAWGFPRLELFGAGLATSTVNFGTFLASTLVCHARAGRSGNIICSDTSGASTGALMRQLVAIGAPISISFLLEYGLFSPAALLMGLISTTALAAHQIALQVTAILFMVPFGISMAATVRVGHAVGRNDAAGVRRAGLVAMLLGIALVAALTLAVIAAALRSRGCSSAKRAPARRRHRADRDAAVGRRDLLHRRRRADHRGRRAARHERYAHAAVVRRDQLLADRLPAGLRAGLPDAARRGRRLDRTVARHRGLCHASGLALPPAGGQDWRIDDGSRSRRPMSIPSALLAGAQFIDAFRIEVEATALDARHAAERMMRRSPRWIETLMPLAQHRW